MLYIKKNFQPFDVKELKLDLWEELPDDFSLGNIDKRILLDNDWITALGIWYIDPNSKYLDWIEKGIEIIREGIKKRKFERRISANFLEESLNISQVDSEVVIRLSLIHI